MEKDQWPLKILTSNASSVNLATCGTQKAKPTMERMTATTTDALVAEKSGAWLLTMIKGGMSEATMNIEAERQAFERVHPVPNNSVWDDRTSRYWAQPRDYTVKFSPLWAEVAVAEANSYTSKFEGWLSRAAQDATRIAELERINFALNAAAWEFTHSWINNEVDQDDDEWMDVMADLTERAGAVMRLVRPPAA